MDMTGASTSSSYIEFSGSNKQQNVAAAQLNHCACICLKQDSAGVGDAVDSDDAASDDTQPAGYCITASNYMYYCYLISSHYLSLSLLPPNWAIESEKNWYRTLARFSRLRCSINRDLSKGYTATTFPLPNHVSGAPVRSTVKYQWNFKRDPCKKNLAPCGGKVSRKSPIFSAIP